MNEPRESYHHHAGFYREIKPDDDLSKPWEWSPVTTHSLLPSPLKPAFDIPREWPSGRDTAQSSADVSMAVAIIPSSRKLGLWARLVRFVKSGSFSSTETIKIEIPVYSPSVEDKTRSKVEPREWKQYGYWARPYVNGVECPNSPAMSEKTVGTEVLRDIMLNLRSPRGPNGRHPERWVPGLKHRALPPRPDRWKDPIPGEPLPFPWEVQVNPLLQHMLWGPSPLSWCVVADPTGWNMFYGRTPATVPCPEADRAQPATWPFLTHMYFNAVAGDTSPTFPWPFTIFNPRGIKVGDVIGEIYRQFQHPVTDDERMSWPFTKQDAAQKTLQERCRLLSREEMFVDIMRRCDALGGIGWFRGIEPTIDGGGWMITFGTH